MAAKFLPFITEKSSGSAIFKSIVQRTKGSTKASVLALFSIVLNMGINKVQKKIDSYDKNLTTSDKMKQLVAEHNEFHVSLDTLVFWTSVMYMERTDNKPHPIFSKSELEMFFCVLACVRPEELKEEGFDIDVELYKKYADKDFDTSLAYLENINITEKDSERVAFSSWEEFKAFIAFNEKPSETHVRAVLPIFLSYTGDGPHNTAVYENNSCISPYGSVTDET